MVDLTITKSLFQYVFLLFHMRFIGYFFVLLGMLALLFFIRQRHFFFILIYLELILLGISLLFLNASIILNDGRGFIIVFIILVIAAVETAVGLALLINYSYVYPRLRLRKVLHYTKRNQLRMKQK